MTEPTVSCCLCGEVRANLTSHIRTAHQTTTHDYAQKFPGCRLAAPRSAETRQKLSSALVGRALPLEQRQKMSNSHKGKVKTQEHVERVAARQRGVPKTLEARKNMSEARKGMRLSDSHRAAIGRSLIGRPVNEETRSKQALRAANRRGYTRNKFSDLETAFMHELDALNEPYQFEPFRIPYMDGRVVRQYTPDFYLPDHAMVVEIKSTYWFRKCRDLVVLKLQAAVDAGYNTLMVLDGQVVYWNRFLREV